MDPNRALTPVDRYAGYRTRLGHRFIGTHYRENVTKLAGIIYALVLPIGNWSVRFAAICDNSRVLLYEDAILTSNGAAVPLINAFRRFVLDANSGGAGRTTARLYVDPIVSATGNKLLDLNIAANPASIDMQQSSEPLILYGNRNYIITVIPRPQLMTVGMIVELWKENRL